MVRLLTTDEDDRAPLYQLTFPTLASERSLDDEGSLYDELLLAEDADGQKLLRLFEEALQMVDSRLFSSPEFQLVC